ncbi:unnamed protein product, partial [Effrenium voratum]
HGPLRMELRSPRFSSDRLLLASALADAASWLCPAWPAAAGDLAEVLGMAGPSGLACSLFVAERLTRRSSACCRLG